MTTVLPDTRLQNAALAAALVRDWLTRRPNLTGTGADPEAEIVAAARDVVMPYGIPAVDQVTALRRMLGDPRWADWPARGVADQIRAILNREGA